MTDYENTSRDIVIHGPRHGYSCYSCHKDAQDVLMFQMPNMTEYQNEWVCLTCIQTKLRSHELFIVTPSKLVAAECQSCGSEATVHLCQSCSDTCNNCGREGDTEMCSGCADNRCDDCGDSDTVYCRGCARGNWDLHDYDDCDHEDCGGEGCGAYGVRGANCYGSADYVYCSNCMTEHDQQVRESVAEQQPTTAAAAETILVDGDTVTMDGISFEF